MSLTVSYECCLSLTVSPVPWSCCILSLSPIVTGCHLLSLLSFGVATCLSLFLPVPCGSACLSLSPKISGHLLLSLLYQGVAACLSLAFIVAGCLSKCLPMPSSYCMSLTVYYVCWLSCTVSPLPWSCYMSLTVSSSSMEMLHVSHCLPWFLAVSLSSMLLLHVS